MKIETQTCFVEGNDVARAVTVLFFCMLQCLALANHFCVEDCEGLVCGGWFVSCNACTSPKLCECGLLLKFAELLFFQGVIVWRFEARSLRAKWIQFVIFSRVASHGFGPWPWNRRPSHFVWSVIVSNSDLWTIGNPFLDRIVSHIHLRYS